MCVESECVSGCDFESVLGEWKSVCVESVSMRVRVHLESVSVLAR